MLRPVSLLQAACAFAPKGRKVRAPPTSSRSVRFDWVLGLSAGSSGRMAFLVVHVPFFSLGTHYFRGINNLQQPWNSWTGRKKHELKPNNPTEEGLASIHSVLFRKDPFLWRAALLYYTVYRASQMSFCELFKDIGKFVKDPGTRWDYCVRAKRGWTDTSQPGGRPSTAGVLARWAGYVLAHQPENSLTCGKGNLCCLRPALLFPGPVR